eukprot:5488136-Pyramimonas_sp.AAC.1
MRETAAPAYPPKSRHWGKPLVWERMERKTPKKMPNLVTMAQRVVYMWPELTQTTPNAESMWSWG